MSEQRRSERVLASITAGVVIGVVEVVLAISFAALVFGGYLAYFLAERHRPVPRGGRADARDPRVEGGHPRRGGQRAGRGGGRARGRRHDHRPEHVRQPQPGVPHRRRGDHGRDAPDGHHVPGDRHVQARQPDPVRAVPGRRRLPRRHRMAPPQGRRLRRLGCGGAPEHDRIPDRLGGADALAPRPRVRRDPADRRPAW